MLIDLNIVANALKCNQGINNVHVFECIESTNDYLLSQIPIYSEWQVCLAQSQSKGKGRRNNHWVSPMQQQLICSLSRRLVLPQAQLPALSLVIALALSEVGHRYDIPMMIKWPNDLWLNGKKLGGILIETRLSHQVGVVIGFGMNYIAPDNEYSGLQSSLGTTNINDLFYHFIVACIQIMDQYASRGFAGLHQQYQRYMLFSNQHIRYMTSQGQCYGRVSGVDTMGRLMIEDGGNIHYYFDHEIHTIRPDDVH